MKNPIDVMIMIVFSVFIIMGSIFVVVGFTATEVLFVFVGGLFAMVGCVAMASVLYRRYVQRKVQRNGMAIYTDILDIILEHTRVNDIRAYRVRTQWLDIDNNVLYYFQSNYIAENPTRKLENIRKIKVMVNPKNYAQYYMDLSFL